MSTLQARRAPPRSISADIPRKQEEEIKLGISTTIRGNSSADNAVQFNAPVAGTIIYCQTMNVNFTAGGSNSLSPTNHNGLENILQLFSTSPRQSKDAQSSITEIKTTPEGLLFCPLPSQYIKLLSDSNNKFRKVYALYRPNSKCNWIARRIVAYLRLTSHPHQPIREAVFEGNTIKSVGRFVELTCALQESTNSSKYCFYIAEHSPFDMLLGSDFTS